jgi:hypothetical protein
MPPIPRTTVPQPVYLAPPGTVALSCPDSEVSSNPAYTWTLVAWPEAASPSLTGQNTPNPQLLGASAPGTYVVFLSITDSTGASHPVPYPTQAQTPPYGFTTPLASAFALVRVAEANGLVKPAKGQYGWLEDLWSVIDSLDYYDEATKELRANSIVPATGTSVSVRADSVVINGEASLELRTEGGGDASLYADGNVDIEAGNELTLHNPVLKTEGLIQLSLNDETLKFSYDADSTTNIIESSVVVKIVADGGSYAELGESVVISAADNAAIQAFGTNGVASLYGADVGLTAFGTEGVISLTPGRWTTSTKTVDAPGIARHDTAMRVIPAGTPPAELVLFSGESTSPYYTKACVFNHHDLGSELRCDLALSGFLDQVEELSKVQIRVYCGPTDPGAVLVTTAAQIPAGSLGTGQRFTSNTQVRICVLDGTKLMISAVTSSWPIDNYAPMVGVGWTSAASTVHTVFNTDLAVRVELVFGDNASITEGHAHLTSTLYKAHNLDVL